MADVCKELRGTEAARRIHFSEDALSVASSPAGSVERLSDFGAPRSPLSRPAKSASTRSLQRYYRIGDGGELETLFCSKQKARGASQPSSCCPFLSAPLATITL